MITPPKPDEPLESEPGDEPGTPLIERFPEAAPAPAPAAPPPPGWLFAPSTLGGSFRVYLPTILAVRMLGLARMIAFAYLIDQTEYGLQRLALQLINLLSAIARLGVPVGIERYVPHYEQAGQLAQFVRRGLWLATFITAGLTLALAAVSPWMASFSFEGAAAAAGAAPPTAAYLLRITLACLLVTLVLSLYLNLQGTLRGLRMYRAMAASEFLHGVTFLAFGLAGLFLAGKVTFRAGHMVQWPGAASVLTVAYGVSLLVSAVWIGLGLIRHLSQWQGQHQPMELSFRQTASQLLRFSSFMTVSNILWMLFLIFGLWYLNKLHGNAEAGLFALSRDLMQAVQLLALAVWPAAQNSANHLWARGLRDQAVAQLGLVFRLSGWPLWILAALLVLFRYGIEALLPGKYVGAAPLMPWLLMMFMWMIHLCLPIAQAYLLANSRVLMVAAAVGLAVHAGSSVWLVRIGWATGAAQSAALGAAVAMCVLLVFVGRSRERRAWLTARDVPLLLAPLLLAVPTAWRYIGDYILAAATLSAIVLLLLTDLLWSRDDRRTLGRYVMASIALVLRRGSDTSRKDRP
ncbi:MAG: oligosaccharide flippase family protein [Phycisphaerae bacterium]|nr:oligosaccharide flippase family protein [Phycisphaerae bacterium]